MNEDVIFEQLTQIFRDVFDDDEITISTETTAPDIEDWDSISNIQLLVTIEQAFNGIKFSTGEVANMKNVGEMVDAIKKKIGS
jgi:acyl carrier protein